jgi:hypothetical protein
MFFFEIKKKGKAENQKSSFSFKKRFKKEKNTSSFDLKKGKKKNIKQKNLLVLCFFSTNAQLSFSPNQTHTRFFPNGALVGAGSLWPHLEHLQECSVGDPAKIFLTSKFSYLLFPNPTHKTKIGMQIGGYHLHQLDQASQFIQF